ncbi:MAG: FAD-binding oxidoreductase [Rhodospirillaceae bacterium]|nr:FAD-binding oxidoreductase [Rhodospirillaceae bacterium]
MSAETYYQATSRPLPKFAKLEGSVEVDVCVVGGGFTGVSAALHLAERGYSVALLEAERIGYGASGRNGGQIVNGYAADMSRIRHVAGLDAALQLWNMGREALADIEARIAQHDIECDFRRGYFFAALNQRQLNDLARMQRDWADTYGYAETRLIRKDLVSTLVGTDKYVGGLADPGSGHMHPLKYLVGLAEAAQSAGVRFFEGSRVSRVEGGNRPRVMTEDGEVHARFLALCGNAYLGRLIPRLHKRLAPVISCVGATERLPRDLLLSALPQDVAVSDCNTALNYYRRTPDDRILFGAGARYTPGNPGELETFLRDKMVALFPQLHDARMETAWCGQIGVTVNRIPDFGRLQENVFYAQGFAGHGVALTGLAGKLMAEAISGQPDRFNVFAGIRHRAFPGGPLRTGALVLTMEWLKLRDRLG